MLTKQDLLDIRDFLDIRRIVKEEVGEGIKTQVPPLVRAIVREEIDSLMEYQIMPQFELLNAEIAWIKNSMATKSFVEERLEGFRVDLGLSYRTAS